MVVAWQCSQCLIELADEQMAVGVDAVPPSAAAASPVADDASTHHSRPQDSAAKQWTSTTKDNHTPLAQELDGSTSNNRVQALSVSNRILPSPPAAAQQKT